MWFPWVKTENKLVLFYLKFFQTADGEMPDFCITLKLCINGFLYWIKFAISKHHQSPCRIFNHFAIYGLHQHNSKLATKSLQDL